MCIYVVQAASDLDRVLSGRYLLTYSQLFRNVHSLYLEARSHLIGRVGCLGVKRGQGTVCEM